MNTASRLLTLVLVISAFAAGYLVNRYQQTGTPGQATASIDDLEDITATDEAAPNYVCPMHAHIHSDQPGSSCPICGMDLVLVEPEETPAQDDSGLPAVSIKPEVINNLGVRTDTVKRGTLTRHIDTMGMISKISSTRNIDVTPEIPGRLKWISDKREGDTVKQGEVLYKIFSPERIQAQKEYLESWKAQDHALLPAMWEALRELKFSDMDVKKLEETGEIEELYPVIAPQTGAVMSQRGVVGNRVLPGSRIYTIGGNFRVDMNAEIFEQHWGLIAFRQKAEIHVPSVRNGDFEGIVQTINNAVNYKTRSLTANIAFITLNPALREGMVADVTIKAAPRENVLYVPRDAVIRTAKQTRVVTVDEDGRFRPRIVDVGLESGDYVEVLDGLDEGQEIVVSGQFLIDSESSLAASFRRMSH